MKQAELARRHLVAAASRKPDHRRRNRVIALVGAGLVVGGAAGGFAKRGRGRGEVDVTADESAPIPT